MHLTFFRLTKKDGSKKTVFLLSRLIPFPVLLSPLDWKPKNRRKFGIETPAAKRRNLKFLR
jgi:hypothetical protein